MSVSRILKNKYFTYAITCILISILFFCNATHRIALFDVTIIYEYGYLLQCGYTPFTDFSTPLLPFAGLLQQICYKLFGLNYFSGIMGAWIVTIVQLTIIYFTISKMAKDHLSSAAYSFLITVTCLPFIGTLFYNHLSMALITTVLSQALYIQYAQHNKTHDKNIPFHVSIAYVLLAFIVTIKLQIGVALFCGLIFLDSTSLLFIQRKAVLTIARQLAFRLALFFVPTFLIFVATNSNPSDYLHGIKHISVMENIIVDRIISFLALPDIGPSSTSPTITYLLCVIFLITGMKGKSYIKNILLFSVVLCIYMLPIIAFNIIPLSVFLRHGIFMPLTAIAGLLIMASVLYIVTFKNKDIPTMQDLSVLTLITIAYVLSFLIIMNSLEVLNIILCITVFFILVFDYLLIKNHNHRTFFNRSFKPAFLICLFCYSVVYSTFSIRKDFWHHDGGYMKFFLEKSEFTDKQPELKRFFKHVKVSKESYRDYSIVDSVVKAVGTKNILFGPELEMFNIIYGIQPPKQWPLWFHWQLTVSERDTARMIKIAEDKKFDLIVLSPARPYILNSMIIRDYDTIQTGEKSFEVFLKRKTKPSIDSSVVPKPSNDITTHIKLHDNLSGETKVSKQINLKT